MKTIFFLLCFTLLVNFESYSQSHKPTLIALSGTLVKKETSSNHNRLKTNSFIPDNLNPTTSKNISSHGLMEFGVVWEPTYKKALLKYKITIQYADFNSNNWAKLITSKEKQITNTEYRNLVNGEQAVSKAEKIMNERFGLSVSDFRYVGQTTGSPIVSKVTIPLMTGKKYRAVVHYKEATHERSMLLKKWVDKETYWVNIVNYYGNIDFVSNKPERGFIYNNSFYVKPDASGNCPPNTKFDSKNCWILKQEKPKKAVELDGKWYATKALGVDTDNNSNEGIVNSPNSGDAGKSYNGDFIKGMVSGDFDGDGKSDVATAYSIKVNTHDNDNKNNTRIDVFKSDGTKFSRKTGWRSNSYNGDAIQGMVSGDFDGDGKDDIAMAYYHGNNITSFHVFKSDGKKFNYQGDKGWWRGTQYAGDRIKGRMISGDYNGDGKDDIATVYYYGKTRTSFHVLLSDGTKFKRPSTDGWWTGTKYAADRVTGRVVSGDYNGDGKDDIATVYYYGKTRTSFHVLLSDGTKFKRPSTDGWWTGTQYAADRITGRVVSGDYNGDGKDDVATLYRYGKIQTHAHILLSEKTKFKRPSTAGWWNSKSYSPEKVTNRTISGDFNGDGKDDLATAYYYGSNITRIHVFKSDGTKLKYQGDKGWW